MKRELVKLLILAYRKNRRRGMLTVSREDFQKAYISFEFTAARKDIDLPTLGQADNNKTRMDLWCPLGLPLPMTSAYNQALEESRLHRVSQGAVEASFSQAERKSTESFKSENKASNSQNNFNFQRIKRTGKNDAESLKANVTRASKIKFWCPHLNQSRQWPTIPFGCFGVVGPYSRGLS